jgi:hypothetical protein
MAQPESMFGPTPDEVIAQRQAQQDQFAQQYATMDPYQRVNYGWAKSGNQLGNLGASLFGLQDPNVIKAQQTQQAMSGVDTNDPSALLQAAVAMRAIDPARAAAIAAQARDIQQKQAETKYKLAQAAYEQKKADTEANPFAKIDPSKFTPESLKAFVAGGSKDQSLLIASDKEQKLSDYAKSLVDEGIPYGTPEFTRRMKQWNDAAVAAKNAPALRIQMAGKGSPYNLSDEQQNAIDQAIRRGLLNPDRVNSRSAIILANQFLKNPDLDMVGQAARANLQKNATFVNKAELVRAIPEILSNMVDAGKKIGYSDNRTIGKMQAFVKGEFNDPDYTEYMAQRNDALLTIAGTMRAAGMSDQAHRAEIEAASPTMSPAALDAWLRGQTKSLAVRVKIADKYLGKQDESTPDTPIPVKKDFSGFSIVK